MKTARILFLYLLSAVSALAIPTVTVGIPPQAHIVKQIAGDTVEVSVFLEPGASPATYNPSIAQLNRLGNSDIYFLMGLPFENRVISKIKSILPSLYIVDTRKGITLRYFTEVEGHDHAHEHDHHEAADPHVWMSIENLKIMAQTIQKELTRLSPENTEFYQQNCEIYLSKLNRIEKELGAIMKPHKGEYIAVYHPAFGYLFESYGIHQLVIEQMGKEPSASELLHLSEAILDNNVHTLISQSQFSDKTARILASKLGIKLLTENPLEEDTEDNLLFITKRVFSTED